MNPQTTVVLSNDVAEGPDFRRLAERGFSIYTIYHVDVIDYFVRLYFRSRMRPQTLTRLYDRLTRTVDVRWLPDIVRLLLQKQKDSVYGSKGLIVPSQAMRQVLLDCYPGLGAERIHVLPWGIWDDAQHPTSAAIAHFRQQHGLAEGTRILLTLSRISPEKGQDRLLEALLFVGKIVRSSSAGRPVSYPLRGGGVYALPTV